jgi:hypothetical protein
VTIRNDGGHRARSNIAAKVSGFTAENVILPDDRASTVFTNADAVGAATSRRITPCFRRADAEVANSKDARGLQDLRNQIDRACSRELQRYFSIKRLRTSPRGPDRSARP